jgi:hypothetical protein
VFIKNSGGLADPSAASFKYPFDIKPSKVHGNGLFATENLKAVRSGNNQRRVKKLKCLKIQNPCSFSGTLTMVRGVMC